MKQHRKIHLDTEVWSWGAGDHGQLGHADLLHRSWLSHLSLFDTLDVHKHSGVHWIQKVLILSCGIRPDQDTGSESKLDPQKLPDFWLDPHSDLDVVHPYKHFLAKDH